MPNPKYRLAVLTNSVSRVNGGIFDSMRNLTIAVAAGGRYHPLVFGARDTYTSADAPSWGEIPIQSFPVFGPRIFGYAPGLDGAINASRADILHVHGIWMHPSTVALRWSRGKKPYIVSPHGLLKPTALRNSRWKKRIAAFLYENEHLRRAACLHALNGAEAQSLRDYGLTNPICIIPNGTTLRNDNGCSEPRQDRTILYLGRLHPLKGLRPLIEAWSLVCEEASAAGWRLTLAGRDQNRHRAELEQLADRLRTRATITFLGAQFGSDKDRCLAAASAFILPSRSEGLPMSILEAWSWRLPVLMTRECNLPEGGDAGAAIMMDSEAENIAAGLRRLFSLADSEREQMGQNGRRLVEDRFQWQRIGESMTQVYNWLLGEGPMPNCVSV